MAYETGTLSTVIDLIDKFRLFAISQGWAVNRWVTVSTGRELCIQKGSQYYNFRAYSNETVLINGAQPTSKYGIGLNGSDGYSSGSPWDRQPGYPVRASIPAAMDQAHCYFPIVLSTGPFPAYHFFAPDSKTLYVEVEIATSTFIRFGCGALDLFNPAAPGGGRFCYATTGNASIDNTVDYYSWLGSDCDNTNYAVEYVPFRAADVGTSLGLRGSMVRCAFSSFDNWAGSARSIPSDGLKMACQGGGIHDKPLREYSPNPLNGQAVLLPNIVSLNISDLYLCPIGVVPGLRYLDITNYLPGDEFSLGSETWKVFPWYQKGGVGYNRGIAYLKV